MREGAPNKRLEGGAPGKSGKRPASGRNAHPQEAAKSSARCGHPYAATVEAANAHRSYQVQPVTVEQLGEQQKIADAFFKAGSSPQAVDAKDVETWAALKAGVI